MKYTHLSKEERIVISTLLKEGKTKSYIAKELGRDPSTVGREIKRNSSLGTYGLYTANQAHKRSIERKTNHKASKKLTGCMRMFIKYYYEQEQWSPEQINGYCNVNNIDMVSHETIYQYIYSEIRAGDLSPDHLRRHRKRRRKRLTKKDMRGTIPNRISIERRPAIVDDRSRIGDWEADTIIGKNHKGAILTLTERKSRYGRIIKLNGKNAEQLANKFIQAMSSMIPWIHTITFDNGKEFSRHELIAEKLQTDNYFAHPYSSHERGSNENMNGLIRQYLPKKTNFENVTQKQLDMIELKINTRPRKSLGFKSPKDVLLNHIDNFALAS